MKLNKHIGGITLLVVVVTAQAQTFTSLDAPGAVETYAYGISGGNIVGWYYDSSYTPHGYLYNGGTFTTLDAPGSTATYVWGISRGQIVGEADSGSFQRSVLSGSSYTTLFPNTLTSTYGIDGSNIVGRSYDDSGVMHGFLYNGTTFTTLDGPGAIATSASGISGVNIVGFYTDKSGYDYGFQYDGTTYNTLMDPNANIGAFPTGGTYAQGVSGNNIVGYYRNNSGDHGFLYDGTSYTTLDVPGAVDTDVLGIDGNNIVGYCIDNTGLHGFWEIIGPVPEPSTLALASIVGLGLLLFRHKI